VRHAAVACGAEEALGLQPGAGLPTTLPTTCGVGRGVVLPAPVVPAAAVFRAEPGSVWVGAPPPTPPYCVVPCTGASAVALPNRDIAISPKPDDGRRLDMADDAELDVVTLMEVLLFDARDVDSKDDVLIMVEFELGADGIDAETRALLSPLVSAADGWTGVGLT
jgi:hypothetical protein